MNINNFVDGVRRGQYNPGFYVSHDEKGNKLNVTIYKNKDVKVTTYYKDIYVSTTTYHNDGKIITSSK